MLVLFQGPKNFIITLKNPSLGAKIGNRSAIVCNITKGKYNTSFIILVLGSKNKILYNSNAFITSDKEE